MSKFSGAYIVASVRDFKGKNFKFSTFWCFLTAMLSNFMSVSHLSIRKSTVKSRK